MAPRKTSKSDATQRNRKTKTDKAKTPRPKRAPSASRLVLIRRVAKMRASGSSWEDCASAVSRSRSVIASWAHLECWPEILREECRKVEELLDIELGPVAIRALRRNVESDDTMASNLALATYYRSRHANRKLSFEVQKARAELELKRFEVERALLDQAVESTDTTASIAGASTATSTTAAIVAVAQPVIYEITAPPDDSHELV